MASCAPVGTRRWAAIGKRRRAGYQPAAGCQPAPQAQAGAFGHFALVPFSRGLASFAILRRQAACKAASRMSGVTLARRTRVEPLRPHPPGTGEKISGSSSTMPACCSGVSKRTPTPSRSRPSVAKIFPPTRKSAFPKCEPSTVSGRLSEIRRKSAAVIMHLMSHETWAGWKPAEGKIARPTRMASRVVLVNHWDGQRTDGARLVIADHDAGLMDTGGHGAVERNTDAVAHDGIVLRRSEAQLRLDALRGALPPGNVRVVRHRQAKVACVEIGRAHV